MKYRLFNLVAAITTLLCESSGAAVTLTFEQVSTSVVAKWFGSYQLPVGVPGGSNPASYGVVAGSSRVFGLVAGQSSTFSSNAGTPGPSGILITGAYSGNIFGFDGNALYWPSGVSGLFFPTGTMIFTNTNLVAAGLASYSNTLVFTGNNNTEGNQEIRLTTIPESSSALILTLAFTITFYRRSRKKG